MKVTSGLRKPYAGSSRLLVIALDVGTTFSGVSYAILEPGEIPKIHGVTRFPGQEHVAGNSKIPSVICYDQYGSIKAAGAEADTAAMASLAEEQNWIRAELFKLRLRPKSMMLKMNGMSLTPLPNSKTAVDVFGDFLGYLFRCTRIFIADTHANGQALWSAVENDIYFVLSHPNGWEGAQQAKMRRSAVIGGLIPDTDEGRARIRFVTEGEASLHACVLNGLAADVISNPSKYGFVIADAGGGTLDISSYAIRGTSPLVIDEIAPPDCVFAGSVFVSRRASEFLQERLKNSKYGTPDSVDHITKRFDETTKRLFRDKTEIQFIPFGSPLDKDSSVGIRSGQLKLTGAEVASFFEPSLEAAVSSIKAQIEASGGFVKSVWLVGGFAASPWLFSQLQERLASMGVTVNRPDSQTSKAVADGAIGFFCDHHVAARMSKCFYGVEFLRDYDPNDPEHVDRKHRLCILPSGPKLLQDAFDCILSRNVKVKESTVFTRKYCTEIGSLTTLRTFEVEVWCYRGKSDAIPKWILRDSEEFSRLCLVRADLSQLTGSAEASRGVMGKTYWKIVFSIEIHFGLTEFKARLKWVENGRTRYGPASIVYSEHGLRTEESDPESTQEDNVASSGRNRSRPTTRPQTPRELHKESPRGIHSIVVEPPTPVITASTTSQSPRHPITALRLSDSPSIQEDPTNIPDATEAIKNGLEETSVKPKGKGKEKVLEREMPSSLSGAPTHRKGSGSVDMNRSISQPSPWPEPPSVTNLQRASSADANAPAAPSASDTSKWRSKTLEAKRMSGEIDEPQSTVGDGVPSTPSLKRKPPLSLGSRAKKDDADTLSWRKKSPEKAQDAHLPAQNPDSTITVPEPSLEAQPVLPIENSPAAAPFSSTDKSEKDLKTSKKKPKAGPPSRPTAEPSTEKKNTPKVTPSTEPTTSSLTAPVTVPDAPASTSMLEATNIQPEPPTAAVFEKTNGQPQPALPEPKSTKKKKTKKNEPPPPNDVAVPDAGPKTLDPLPSALSTKTDAGAPTTRKNVSWNENSITPPISYPELHTDSSLFPKMEESKTTAQDSSTPWGAPDDVFWRDPTKGANDTHLSSQGEHRPMDSLSFDTGHTFNFSAMSSSGNDHGWLGSGGSGIGSSFAFGPDSSSQAKKNVQPTTSNLPNFLEPSKEITHDNSRTRETSETHVASGDENPYGDLLAATGIFDNVNLGLNFDIPAEVTNGHSADVPKIVVDAFSPSPAGGTDGIHHRTSDLDQGGETHETLGQKNGGHGDALDGNEPPSNADGAAGEDSTKPEDDWAGITVVSKKAKKKKKK